VLLGGWEREVFSRVINHRNIYIVIIKINFMAENDPVRVETMSELTKLAAG